MGSIVVRKKAVRPGAKKNLPGISPSFRMRKSKKFQIMKVTPCHYSASISHTERFRILAGFS
jgi:hypothetical protein